MPIPTDIMQLEMAALTHKGLVRSHNEDSMYNNVDNRVIIVCDGMGGHAGGHVASEVAMQVVHSSLRMLSQEDWYKEDILIEAMKQAVFDGNDQILERAQQDPALHDMGTTIVAAAFMENRAVFGHVGDSRIYRIYDGEIEQVSEDHSLVNERVKAGDLDPHSEEAHMLSSILTRALGMDHIIVDIIIEDLCDGDIYLMCSDGLTDMVDDDELLRLVLENEDNLQMACMACIDAANANGGIDNITIGLTRVSSAPST